MPVMNRKLLLTLCSGLLAGSIMVPRAFAQMGPDGVSLTMPDQNARAAAQRTAGGRQVGAVEAVSTKAYDLLLKGGHVIDDKNHVDAIMDVAMKDGKIAKVAKSIPASDAIKTVNVAGMYVVPGLIDIHTHVFWGTQAKSYDNGDWSLPPDGFTLRNGVTTIVDAGSAGWRNFPLFKERVIDRSETRVLAMLNIVGWGMGNNGIEGNLKDMDGQKTGEMALKYPGIIVGVKSAHFTGPEWKPYDQAEIAGTMASIPVMVDYGTARVERPLWQLLEEKFRPGDIYTHMYGGGRGEQDADTGGPGKGMREGRARGVYFDVGHGQSSFSWSVAIPLIRAGFKPDSISTDLHFESMNAGMKDLLTTGDKFLAMGLSMEEVIADMTWHPAREVKQMNLGNFDVGSIADVAVLSVRHGSFGLIDGNGTVLKGHEKFECELTIKDGKFVYDLNGMSGDPWYEPPSEAVKLAAHWTKLKVRSTGVRLRAPNAADVAAGNANNAAGVGRARGGNGAAGAAAGAAGRPQRTRWGTV